MLIHLLKLAPEDDNNEVVLVDGRGVNELDPNNNINVFDELEDNEGKESAQIDEVCLMGMATVWQRR
jgi:hypothetical protein